MRLLFVLVVLGLTSGCSVIHKTPEELRYVGIKEMCESVSGWPNDRVNEDIMAELKRRSVFNRVEWRAIYQDDVNYRVYVGMKREALWCSLGTENAMHNSVRVVRDKDGTYEQYVLGNGTGAGIRVHVKVKSGFVQQWWIENRL